MLAMQPTHRYNIEEGSYDPSSMDIIQQPRTTIQPAPGYEADPDLNILDLVISLGAVVQRQFRIFIQNMKGALRLMLVLLLVFFFTQTSECSIKSLHASCKIDWWVLLKTLKMC